jgi:N-acetylmuramoyl-L-alanine amidase
MLVTRLRRRTVSCSGRLREVTTADRQAGTAVCLVTGLGAVALLCTACTGSAGAAGPAGAPQSASSPVSTPPAPAASASPSASATATPARTPKPRLLLAGKIVGIDPGHDGGNFSDPAYLAQQVWNGREYEDCDTTGTETATGYTEARFNFNVATDLAADLRADGARVVLTRHSDTGVGPCVTTRASIINHAHADVAIDIHADGGPVTGRGFTVLEPVADGPNDAVIRPSIRFGTDVHAAILKYTSMPASDYYGNGGVIFRDNLAGLNLTTVPKVLIECGNMPNPTDAALLTRPSFQRELARALTAAIVKFLTGRWTAG